MIHRIWKNKWIVRSILKTIYFNFRYLPFSQAYKLPIILYKPHFGKLKGKICINGPIKTGMICLGRHLVSLYPNNGIVIENHGGTIIFNGKCSIGNNSFVCVGPKAKVIFGDHFYATSSLKLASYYHIEFNNNVLCGWNCLFADTDFHKLTTLNQTNNTSKPYDKIAIGNNCWFAMNNTILKGTVLSDHTIIGSQSLLNKDYSDYGYCMLAGQPATLKKRGIYLDRENDHINYYLDNES